MYRLWSQHPLNEMEGKQPTWFEFKDLDDLANEICRACSLNSMTVEEHFAAVQYIQQVPELLTEGKFIYYYPDEACKDYGAPSCIWVRNGQSPSINIDPVTNIEICNGDIQ